MAKQDPEKSSVTTSEKSKLVTPVPGEANTNGPTDTNGKPNFEDYNADVKDAAKSKEAAANNPNSVEAVKAANEAVRENAKARVGDATMQPTDSKGTPGFTQPATRTPEQMGPDRPGFQEETNVLQSQDLAQGDTFTEKELNHPHVNAFTPNTTMSGGPFTPDTQDKPNQLSGKATLENKVPVKTYVRHPFEAAGNLAGVTSVVVEDKPLSEMEVHQRIAQVLKDGGMDSASQLRAFAQIKVILDAWAPADSDEAITRKEVLERQEQTNEEVDSEMKTEDQRTKDNLTKSNLEKSMLSGQVAKEPASAVR